MLGGCAASSITPLDRAIIQHGCRQTVEQARREIADDDVPFGFKTDAEQRIIKARALDEWTRTGRFPLGAPEDEETKGE